MLMRSNRNYWSPWGEMQRLQREMNRLFDSSLGTDYRRAAGFPAMNVWTSEDAVVVTAELPGVKVEDLDISVVNETLTLSGGREPDEVAEDARYHRRERGCGKFSRSVQLPFPVDADKVEATLKNGALHLSLPRSEADKPKKIAVKSS